MSSGGDGEASDSGTAQPGRGLSGTLAVFGATSGIARAVIREWMGRGGGTILIGRNPEALEREARDLEARFGIRPPLFIWDVLDFAHHAEKAAALLRLARANDPAGLEGFLLASGWMPPQDECEVDHAILRKSLEVNFTGPCLVLEALAEALVLEFGKGRGSSPLRTSDRGPSDHRPSDYTPSDRGPSDRRPPFISCLSSVAGDRGRGSNYAYGAAKAGLSAYLSGLRNRLFAAGILVQTVKPGMVRTAMTAFLPPSPLFAEAEGVGRRIVRAMERREDIVYAPSYWFFIMTVIRLLPEALFKRLKL